MVGEYIPFGDEWKEHLMKHVHKSKVIDMLADALQQNVAAQQGVNADECLCMRVPKNDGTITTYVNPWCLQHGIRRLR